MVVAQLVRASVCGAEGRGFEPHHPPYSLKSRICDFFLIFYMVEFSSSGNKIVTLEASDIIDLHKILCDNFELLPEMEPISPTGVKNYNLLESAIGRQSSGFGDFFKYPDCYSNCATLIFGLVKNHTFHNGNKRIGFLAMIKHLYANGYVIAPGIKHSEIFELLRLLANSQLNKQAIKYNNKFIKQNKLNKNGKWDDDLTIKYIANWLKKIRHIRM